MIPSQIGTPYKSSKKKKDINNEVSRLGVERYKVDAQDFIDAIDEAENAFYPNRVKMQQVLRETYLNPQVQACWNRRKGATMLKKNVFKTKDGKDNEEWTNFFNENFFREIKSYALDALMFGYSLINWDTITDGKISGIKVIKRENVLPDIKHVVEHIYATDGIAFENDKYKNWVLYVPTPSELGISNCGYGALLYCAMNEVYLRNTIGVNAEYLEKFGLPFVVGKTGLLEGEERDRFEDVVKNLRSGHYAVIDNNPSEQIELLQHDTSGNTAEIWTNFYELNHKLIAKVILGHGSALDSTTGKLGSQDEVTKAINDMTKHDMVFIESVVNDNLIPKLRNLGFNIPDGKFCHDNDQELQEEKKAEIEHLTAVATMVKTFKDSGNEVDIKWIEENTGIKLKKIVESKEKPIENKRKSKKNIDNGDADK
jgi:Protein of unknown function (DUF935)